MFQNVIWYENIPPYNMNIEFSDSTQTQQTYRTEILENMWGFHPFQQVSPKSILLLLRIPLRMIPNANYSTETFVNVEHIAMRWF